MLQLIHLIAAHSVTRLSCGKLRQVPGVIA